MCKLYTAFEWDVNREWERSERVGEKWNEELVGFQWWGSGVLRGCLCAMREVILCCGKVRAFAGRTFYAIVYVYVWLNTEEKMWWGGVDERVVASYVLVNGVFYGICLSLLSYCWPCLKSSPCVQGRRFCGHSRKGAVKRQITPPE